MRNLQVGTMLTAAGVAYLDAAGSLISGAKAMAGHHTFQQYLTGSGALLCSYVVEGSNDGGTHWSELYSNAVFNGTVSAAPADDLVDDFSVPENQVWGRYRVRVVSISGTGARFYSYAAEQVETES
jgi:hypothetical protein